MFISYMFFLMIMILFMIMCFKNYFLMFLISMEFFVITNMLLLIYSEIFLNWLFLYYLIFSVCESILGLSLMISLMSLIGTQGFMLMNLKN